jgi:hypothetical protein
MKSEESRKKEFVGTLNVTTIDEDVYPKTKAIVEKTYPFTQALGILLRETEDGRELFYNRLEGKIDAEAYKKGIVILAKKYRHLIVYYDYE